MHTAEMQGIKMSWNAFQIVLFVLYKEKTKRNENEGKGLGEGNKWLGNLKWWTLWVRKEISGMVRGLRTPATGIDTPNCICVYV